METISNYIGADTVIYQTLDDLKAACAEILKENGRSEPTQFEVGVFCGAYVTPVSDGYFEYLENMRGEGRKVKAIESARAAVANGVASDEDVKVVAKGFDTNGKAVAPAPTQQPDAVKNEGNQENAPQVKDRMDISLHNLGDYS